MGVPSACFRRLASCGLNSLNHDLSSCPSTRCIRSVVPIKLYYSEHGKLIILQMILLHYWWIDSWILNIQWIFFKAWKIQTMASARWQNALILFFNMDQLHLGPVTSEKKGCLESHEICFTEWIHPRQIKANMFTYSAALSACDKGSQWFLALELLDKSPRKRLDGRAYCSALSACGKASQWRVALDLFRQSQGVVSW